MVHSKRANNPWLKRYLPDDGKIGKNQYGNHWNTPLPGGIQVCVHGFIGKLADRTYFNTVYKEATELCAYLCKEFGLTEKDIIDHSEGYKKGIASNHGDVKHWFTKHGKTMDNFRADVKKLLNNQNVEEDNDMDRINKLENDVKKLKTDVNTIKNKMVYAWVDDNMPEWAKPTITKLMEKGYLKGMKKEN